MKAAKADMKSKSGSFKGVCPKPKKSKTSPAGKRNTGAVIDCDGIIEQLGIFKEPLQTQGVAQKCSQARDAKAILFVMNTHGAGKYECLWVDGDNLVGSHYTGSATIETAQPTFMLRTRSEGDR